MNGSSRSLTKALGLLVEDWKDNVSENRENADTTELFRVISQFNEKHNDLISIKQSLNVNDELFRIHSSYIKPYNNLGREIQFLEILTHFLPVLVGDEITIWLKTYLKPAVDSAGFDLQIVNKAREFVLALTTNIMPTEDVLLEKKREAIGELVMEYIIQLYIGKKEERYEIINLKVNEEEKDSQIYHERIRYMKKNCEDLLHEYGLKKTKDYFKLINKYLKSSFERLEVLTLLSRLVSSQTSQVYQIVNTDLFPNLLRCLLYDKSESQLLVSLSLFVMLIPQICNKIKTFFPDILVIYIRLTNWELFNEYTSNRADYASKLVDEESLPWDMTQLDPSYGDAQSLYPSNSKIELDILHLVRLLYGLFPLNLSKFGQSPLKFLTNQPAEIFDVKYLKDINSFTIETGLLHEKIFETRIIETTTVFLRSFLYHPNFLRFDLLSLENELENPLLWLFSDYNGDEIGPEEISLSCLGFSPNLVGDIDDSLDHPELPNRSSLTNHDRGFVYTGTGESNSSAGSQANSRHVSRKSSFTAPIYMNFKDGTTQKLHLQKSLQNIKNRQLSTNFLGRNRKDSTSEVKFNDVRFDEGFKEDILGEMDEDREDLHTSFEDLDKNEESVNNSREIKLDAFKSNQSLSDLFSTHEKLFAPMSKKIDSKVDISISPRETLKVTSANSLSEKMKNEPHAINPIASSSTLELSSLRKNSTSDTIVYPDTLNASEDIQNGKLSHGTALDFYQRELLLMRNELEFSSYMKQLNKFHYIKLNLKMNRISREASFHNQSIEHRNNLLKLDNLSSSYDMVVASLNELKLQMEVSATKYKNESSILLNKLTDFESENKDLKTELKFIKNENQVINNNLSQTISETLPEKDFDLNRLKNKLIGLENENKSLMKKVQEGPQHNLMRENRSRSDLKSSDFDASEHEKQVQNLKNEILMLQERNSKISQDLNSLQELFDAATKSYESRLSSSKFDLGKNINSFTLQYEKKIQELSATILKYEGLLEEKNSKITHMSTSKPIAIVGSGYNKASYHSDTPQATRTPSSEILHESYEFELRGRSASIESSSVSQPNQSLTYQNYSSNVHFQQPVPTNTVQPIVRGRGGIQKRSKKFM